MVYWCYDNNWYNKSNGCGSSFSSIQMDTNQISYNFNISTQLNENTIFNSNLTVRLRVINFTIKVNN